MKKKDPQEENINAFQKVRESVDDETDHKKSDLQIDKEVKKDTDRLNPDKNTLDRG